jgi:hypothetical protein
VLSPTVARGAGHKSRHPRVCNGVEVGDVVVVKIELGSLLKSTFLVGHDGSSVRFQERHV